MVEHSQTFSLSSTSPSPFRTSGDLFDTPHKTDREDCHAPAGEEAVPAVDCENYL